MYEREKSMGYNLIVRYDDRDVLEIWIPEFDIMSAQERESGPYEMFSNAKFEGNEVAWDWLLIPDFSTAYPDVIEEVRVKEDSISDRYDVPEFELYDVSLSEVLEYTYRTLTPDWLKEKPELLTVVVTRQMIVLPPEIVRRANLDDNTHLAVQFVGEDTLQLTPIAHR
jgi:hypothetical protein